MNSFSKLLVMIYSLILVNFTGQSQDYLQKLSRAALELIQQGNSCEAVERDDCKQYYLSAVKTAKDSDSCVACAITELARFEINQGNLESGEKYLGLSMRLVGTPSKADTLLWNLKAENFTLFAMAAYIKGDMVAAMDYLLENAKITEQFGDPKVAALIKVNVSSIHASMGNLEEAIRYGLMAHEELVKHDDKRYATLSSNLASFYFENNNIKEAQQWARKAVFFGKQHDFVNPIASGYNVLASIHGVSNPDSSLYYSTQAIELAKTSNIPRIYAGALHVHGQTLNKLGRYAEAQGFIEKSLEIYIELNDADQFNVYRTAAKNALSFGMYEKAANYLDQVLFYKDSVISIENREITNELLQKYESEKKDKELAESQLIIREKETSRKITLISSILGFVIFTLLLIVLRARYIKGIQKLQQEKEKGLLTAFIKGEEEERTRLSRELHDGIAAMISAAKMNLESIPYLSEEEKMPQISRVKSVLEATHDEIRFIAHNLMPEKLQEEGLVGALRSHIKTIHDSGLLGISFSTDQETYPNLRIQTQQMFYRIIQELINNIVKHSQATKAEVKIYTQQDGKICFEISDNGNGTDKSKLEKGQGLTEIKKRLNLIGADFDFRSQPNTGTKVYIEYKPD